jgi:hypothetical protein
MKSKKLLLAAVFVTVVSLAGCGTAPVRLPERVLVPVAAECPVPDVPAKPAAPTLLYDKSAPDAEKARALAVYIANLHGHIEALTALLDGYAKPKDVSK